MNESNIEQLEDLIRQKDKKISELDIKIIDQKSTIETLQEENQNLQIEVNKQKYELENLEK